MEQLIVILILLAGPDERAVGELLAQDLRERGGERVEVLVGELAHARLEDNWGITVEDLTVSRHIGAQLTKHEPNLVLIHIAGRQMQGDTILDLGLWVGGSDERLSSIAGAGGDAVPGLRTNLMPLLSGLLGKDEGQVVAGPQRSVTDLIKAEEWAKAVARLAESETLSVREHYYRVLAYVRLGNRTAAIDSLNQMKTAFGQHFLVAAAEDLIPAREEPASAPAATESEPAEAGPTGEAEPEAEPESVPMEDAGTILVPGVGEIRFEAPASLTSAELINTPSILVTRAASYAEQTGQEPPLATPTILRLEDEPGDEIIVTRELSFGEATAP